jgi:hypothetical protein
MKRNTLNFVIDLLSALVLLGIIATGLIVRFVLPPGSGRALALWSLGRHNWGDVHFWLAVAAAAMLLVHLALHWQWVCITTVRLLRRGRGDGNYPGGLSRNLAGASLILLLAASLTAFTWVAQANVRPSAGGERRGQSGSPEMAEEHGGGQGGGGQLIRGSMTLAEVSAATGVPVDQIRSRIGLPASVSASERLGQLRQQYGFTMDEVRRATGAER